MSSSESALVVLVPEAEAVVKPVRDQYDPSAAAGMPAHITLLYPFKAPDEVDQMTLDRLRDCFACFEPIPFSLGTIQRFPNEVLYLAPEPNESFRQLTLSIWNLFPETPPYGGRWPDIIPPPNGGSTRERTTAHGDCSRLRDGISAQIADPRDRVQSRSDGHPVWTLAR